MHLIELISLEWHHLAVWETNHTTILFLLFGFCMTIQLLYYWIIFVRLPAHQIKTIPLHPERKAVSVIIAARDEYLNLYENLPAVLEQDYPDYEVIVVNNDSTDDSAILLKNFQLQYPHLKVITLEKNLNFFKGKKFPLSIGIKAAKNEILLFTDADCKPASNRWILQMQYAFTSETGIVLGVGHHLPEKGFLNKLIRFETFFTALQYLSYALAGIPYMGVGRNLAYRKSLFIKNKGFISHYNIPSGDDDLFVNKAARTTPVTIQIHPESHTFSKTVKTFRRLLIQKRRHYSTARYYRPVHQWMLGIQSATQLGFFLSFGLLLGITQIPVIASIGFLIRWISQIIIFKTSQKKLNVNILFLLSPIFEICLLLLQGWVGMANTFSKARKWN